MARSFCTARSITVAIFSDKAVFKVINCLFRTQENVALRATILEFFTILFAQNSRSSSHANLRGGRQQYLEIITAYGDLAKRNKKQRTACLSIWGCKTMIRRKWHYPILKTWGFGEFWLIANMAHTQIVSCSSWRIRCLNRI